MPVIKHQKTRSLQVKPNGRSSDFVSPNFIYGCAGGCRDSYCYVMRYNYDTIYINDNLEDLLTAIAKHADGLSFPKPANQVDPTYWVYDIGCSTDISLHWKHYAWQQVFDFFKQHPKIKATFATKYVNEKLLSYQPDTKIRIRFSLMPQKISSLLEPKTSLINERICAIEPFIEAGYEAHLNFSPIVVYQGWLEDYQQLFIEIDKLIPDSFKESVLAECIFLTHNPWQHERNLARGQTHSEHLLWQPSLQESKRSEYGSQAVRYQRHLKAKFITEWQTLHDKLIPWNKIRYIF
jgi:spore photoproduct lyase